MNFSAEILAGRIYLMYIRKGPESNSAHAVRFSDPSIRKYVEDEFYVGRYTKCVHKKIPFDVIKDGLRVRSSLRIDRRK